MTTEATFRIWAGDKSVDVRTTTEGVSLEALLDLEDGAALESSVYLRVPDPARPAEIRSFLTAMRSLEVAENGDPDQELRIIVDNAPSLDVVNGVMELRLTRELVERPQDKRRTLAGNLGLLYSLSLYLLEREHGIVSYHSTALVDERNKLVFMNGGDASSGKSVLMLDYMARYGPGTDQRVLSTEMGHVSIRDGEMRAYGGAAVDNVSLFSRQPAQAALMARLFPNVELPDPDADVDVRGTDGNVKTPLPVKDYYARQPSYSSRDGYRLVYVLANIKLGAETKPPHLVPAGKRAGTLSSLVGVARQKLGQKQPSWVYAERASLLLPAWYLAGEQRMEANTIEESLDDGFLRAIVGVEGSPVDFTRRPGECWDKIVELLGLNVTQRSK